jgi:hypothetical protein
MKVILKYKMWGKVDYCVDRWMDKYDIDNRDHLSHNCDCNVHGHNCDGLKRIYVINDITEQEINNLTLRLKKCKIDEEEILIEVLD